MQNNLTDAKRLSDAAREWLPPSRTGNPVHASVLFRWSTSGLLTRAGRRIYLKTIRIGASRFVTQEALAEFLAALNDGERVIDVDDSEGAHDSDRRAKDASRALEALGC